MITATAELWEGGYQSVKREIRLEKRVDGVYLNGSKAEMEYNGIQLRFTYYVAGDRHLFILIDGRTDSDLSIEEMHQQLS